MSSLGDLLLGRQIRERSPSPRPEESKQPADESPHQTVAESTCSSKVFSERVEKDTDVQSNASSTDDYVRELLDPDDRPRNVWHVVEGPKVPSDTGHDDDNSQSIASNANTNSNLDSNAEISADTRSDRYNERFDDTESNVNSETLKNSFRDRSSADKDQTRDSDRSRRSKDKYTRNDERSHDSGRPRDEFRERESVRDRHRGRSKSGHHRDRSSDRERDSDRHRSSRHRSHRGRKHSDHEEDDQGRHSSRRHRRSRSRSGTPSRRRERSKSDSRSPITKRNSRTILIMQLSPRVGSRDLEDFFSDIGRVREVRLIMDSKTRRHKGIAYIEFEDAASAHKAFALNGQKFLGKPMVIQSALLDRNKSSGDWTPSSISHSSNHAASHSSSRSNLPPNSYRVYVGGLHVNLTEEMIRSVFEPFGPIIRLELMKDRVTNVSRGYAFITYENIEDGQSAVQALDGFELAGKSLRVSKSQDKSEHS